MESLSIIKKIAFISTFSDRHCETTSFTRNLIDEFSRNYPHISTAVIAVTDGIKLYDHSEIMQYEISEDQLSTYLRAADYININEFDIVCILHDFLTVEKSSINNQLTFLEHIEAPKVTALHTIISNPNILQLEQIKRLCLLTTRFVVSTQTAVQTLQTRYFIPPEKLELIAHKTGVAQKYLHSFESTRQIFSSHILNNHKNASGSTKSYILPPLKLDHLILMTDSTGVLQHAKNSFPDYSEGYCTDDNARALILMLLASQLNIQNAWLDNLKSRTIAFLNFALNRGTSQFRNFLGYNREWLDEKGSEDSHGRAVWALGCCINKSDDSELQSIANRLFHIALKPSGAFSHPRSLSFILLGVNEYLKKFPGDCSCEEIELELSKRIFTMFQNCSSSDWPWCEDVVTYDNARIIQGLLSCGDRLKRTDFIDTGLKSLRWLVRIQTADNGNFSAIGSNGFFKRGSTIAKFDQQPIEATAMISSCIEAFKITGDTTWIESARAIFSWFLGANDQCLALYDETSGGCRDALHADRVNRNQGAESTIAFLTSLAEMYLLEKQI